MIKILDYGEFFQLMKGELENYANRSPVLFSCRGYVGLKLTARVVDVCRGRDEYRCLEISLFDRHGMLIIKGDGYTAFEQAISSFTAFSTACAGVKFFIEDGK